MPEQSNRADNLEPDPSAECVRQIANHTGFYDHPNGLYRIAGSDRTYTHNELVESLEGDVTGLDLEEWAENYLQLRDHILSAGAAGIITIVGIDAHA